MLFAKLTPVAEQQDLDHKNQKALAVEGGT